MADNSSIYLEHIATNSHMLGESSQQVTLSDSGWVDPISDPKIALFSFGGAYMPMTSMFGYTRQVGSIKIHQGLDIFALPNTEVLACVTGQIIFRGVVTDYGNSLVLKVKNNRTFRSLMVESVLTNKLSNSRAFPIGQAMPVPSRKTIVFNGPGWDGNAEYLYFFYAHLSSFDSSVSGNVPINVNAGQLIGLSGVTGDARNTRAPHLHFEVRCGHNIGRGLSGRANPLYFLNCKLPDELSNDSYHFRTDRADRDYQNSQTRTAWR